MAGAVGWNGRLLYRHILKAAKRFPSVKRERIVQEIRAEFRENAGLADPQAQARARRLALEGLAQLREYAGLGAEEGQDLELYLKGATLGEGGG